MDRFGWAGRKTGMHKKAAARMIPAGDGVRGLGRIERFMAWGLLCRGSVHVACGLALPPALQSRQISCSPVS